MLVVNRKDGETVVLASPHLEKDITVTVCESKPNRVKIGVDAPRSVIIARGELLPWCPDKAEQGEKPDIWLKADRAKARQNAGPRGRAYIEALEQIARLADQFWTAMDHHTRSPEEYVLSEALLDALTKVNFLAEQDQVEDEDLAKLDVLAPETVA